MRKYYNYCVLLIANMVGCLFLLPPFLFSQNAYFHKSESDNEKYFVALGYGAGKAYWSSVFKSTEFYNKDGSVFNTGDFYFSASSPSRHYDVNVMAPVKRIRLGLGISFEFNYLSLLKIDTKNGDAYLVFDEGLRFDKVYLQSEVPLKQSKKNKYSVNWNFRLGWFGYTSVKRIQFIGEAPFPVSVLAATGVICDYEIYPKVYVYLLPNLEYKFYDNSRTEAPVQIQHTVFTASVLGGIRVDLGRFYN